MAAFSFRPKSLLWALSFAVAGSLTAPAAEGSSAAERRAVKHYDVKVAGSSMNAGAARASVWASPEVLRAVVTDYAHYADFLTRFEQARIVGRSGTRTDVYMEVPILKGAAKIWAIVRFDPPQTEGADHVIRGRMVKGNVKRLDAVWRIRKLNDRQSQLDLELLIVPDLPAPRSVILSEVRGAAANAVNGARGEAERRGPKK